MLVSTGLWQCHSSTWHAVLTLPRTLLCLQKRTSLWEEGAGVRAGTCPRFACASHIASQVDGIERAWQAQQFYGLACKV